MRRRHRALRRCPVGLLLAAAVMGVLKGTFSEPMPDGKGGMITPTGKAFAAAGPAPRHIHPIATQRGTTSSDGVGGCALGEGGSAPQHDPQAERS